jgi:nicotinamide-nucleotide amidase
MFDMTLWTLAEKVVTRANDMGLKIATAESCTGGLVSGLLTEIPGSSKVLERGFVTYSNDAKAQVLGVPVPLLKEHGAVSEAVVRAMAEGALAHAPVDLTVALTGIAGPGGGTADKPVGLVHMATASKTGVTQHDAPRFGELGRTEVRLKSVERALHMLLEQLDAPRVA